MTWHPADHLSTWNDSQVLMEDIHGFVEPFSKSLAEEFIQDGAAETFHESIGPWTAHLCIPVFDLVEIQEYVIKVDRGTAFEPGAIVREDGLDGQAMADGWFSF